MHKLILIFITLKSENFTNTFWEGLFILRPTNAKSFIHFNEHIKEVMSVEAHILIL